MSRDAFNQHGVLFVLEQITLLISFTYFIRGRFRYFFRKQFLYSAIVVIVHSILPTSFIRCNFEI